MTTITIKPKYKKEYSTIKKVLFEHNIECEETESYYNKDFVEKILQGDKDIKAGNGRKINVEELNALWK